MNSTHDDATTPETPRIAPTLDDVLRSVRNVQLLVGAVVVLLCVLLLRDANTPLSADASAQTRGGQPAMVNPADQRNEMVAQLERLNAQLDALRKQLDGGRAIKVEVTSMPREDRAATR